MRLKSFLLFFFLAAAGFGGNFDIVSITFVEKGQPYAAPVEKGLFLRGVKTPDEIIFRHEMEMYLGLKSNSSTLNEIKKEAQKFYWRRGYDDVVVTAPEQPFDGGRLFLVIDSPPRLKEEVEYLSDENAGVMTKNYPYDEVSPSRVPKEGEGKIYDLLPAEKPSVSKRGDKILVKQLLGIYFFSDPQQAGEPLREEAGIHMVGEALPAAGGLAERLQVFLRRPITITVLKRLQEEVSSYYREIGYSLVNVSAPPGQDIASGYVRLVILFGRLGTVTCEGARFFSNEKIARCISAKQGEIINSATVLEDLNWINNSPYRVVNLYYRPGDQLGETDIVLKVKDRVPMRVYAGYIHSGYEVGGSSRWTMGLNTGRIFGIDDQFNAQFMCGMSIGDWWCVSGNYVLPLPWRNYLKFYGNAVRARATQMTQDFNQDGKGWYAGGRYEIPLPVLYKLVHNFAIGYDFKRTNNFLSVSSNLIYNNYTDISEFLLIYNGSVPDNYGVNTFSVTLVLSPGDMTRYNTRHDFNAQRSGAKPNYIYAMGSYDRATGLPFDFSWLFNFFGQVATGKLLPTEELSVGGQYTVRGYKENAVVGDMGFLLKNELRTPSMELFFRRVSASREIRDEVQWLLFVDMGWAGEVDKNVVDVSSEILASVGAGVRYKVKDFFDLRFDYGIQLKNNKERLVGNGREGRGHLSLQLSY